jgi:(Z)-2-((N-methylformamido)methylene)-5-hydroxybutyrolactone dehydrogenase
VTRLEVSDVSGAVLPADVRRYDHFIAGDWSPAASGERMASFNPSTGEPWYEFARGGAEDADRAVRSARSAFRDPSWSRLTSTQRGKLLRRVAELVQDRGEEIALLESMDNGKLLREMRVQIGLIAEYLQYFAGIADKVHGEVIPVLQPDVLNYTQREPVGVIAAITPWNSPLLLAVTKLAPALAAGNTVVVKPSEHTSASTLLFADLAMAAGFPPGVVNVVTGTGEEVGAALVAHPEVDKVSFTGGTETGREIGRVAGGRLARMSLELGGKSPQIVFEDADLGNAAMGVISGIFAAAGQTCIAGSRIFLHDSVYDEVLSRVAERAAKIKIGSPQDDTTELGPLALHEQLDKVRQYVGFGIEDGATLSLGGREPQTQNGGWFFEPTIFTDVSNDMRIASDEIFGPVASVMRFTDEQEAIGLANDTKYGLAAGIWTRNLARAHRVAAAVDAGVVWVNMYRTIAPASPVGGFKQSGVGKENGFEVMREYTRTKSVWINMNEGPIADPFVIGQQK